MYNQVVKDDGKLSLSQMIVTMGVVLILLMGGTMAWLWSRLPPELPWFYSLPWGEAQLIQKEWFAGMLLGLLGLFGLTKVISDWVGGRDEVTKNAVLSGGLVVVVMYLLSFIRVISIVIGL